MMKNTRSAPVYDTEITKRHAQKIWKMFHVVLADRGPYLFQGEHVDDKVVRAGINETVKTTSVVGSFTWGLTSTSTSSEDRTYRSIGARVYVKGCPTEAWTTWTSPGLCCCPDGIFKEMAEMQKEFISEELDTAC